MSGYQRVGKSWPPSFKRTYPSGKVSWMVATRLDASRIRRTFSTRDEMEGFAESLRAERRAKDLGGATITPELRLEAMRCQEALAPHGWTLTQAVEHCLTQVIPYDNAPTISEIVDRMIIDAQEAKRKPWTMHERKSRLGAFARVFGDRKLATITQDELREYLSNPGWALVTKKNHRKIISMVYNFALNQVPPWVSRNLVKTLTKLPKAKSTIEVFTVDEAEALLRHADAFQLLPYVAIGLFSGVRVEAIKDLDWSDVKWESRRIIIPAELEKMGRRRPVTINDTLAAWIEHRRSCHGKIASRVNFPKQLRALSKAAGLSQWKRNAMRHSFASYHLARWGNIIETHREMGHTQSLDTLRNHYLDVVDPSDAERFWALRRIP